MHSCGAHKHEGKHKDMCTDKHEETCVQECASIRSDKKTSENAEISNNNDT